MNLKLDRWMRPSDFAEHQLRKDLSIGATLAYPQDQYGYVIIAASATGKVLTARRLATPGTDTGHEPSHFDGPYPVWHHTYTDEELLNMARGTGDIRVHWSEKRGCYTDHGASVFVGRATYYRNFSY